MFFYLGASKWEVTAVFRAHVTLGHRVKQTGHAAACLHWSSAAGMEGYLSPPLLTDLGEDNHISIHASAHAHMWGHVNLSLATSFFFSFLFPLKAKWFYMTWRLIACDIRGSVSVTLCISDLGRPGGADAKISSVVISGQRLIHFIGLTQSQGKKQSTATWEGAFRKQKCAFTAVDQHSLPLVHHIAGRARAGWTDRFSTFQVPNVIWKPITQNHVSCNVK